ncbi:EF-hand calcium-binding domain-containing protein 8 isoform X2 [Paroedura picta]|uniref:EF-hand calcium-binding domain-containing protein 8 isoform X2 n=1 Tax=Paroedura picta TaxID=143630 RepID=UPI0040573E06
MTLHTHTHKYDLWGMVCVLSVAFGGSLSTEESGKEGVVALGFWAMTSEIPVLTSQWGRQWQLKACIQLKGSSSKAMADHLTGIANEPPTLSVEGKMGSFLRGSVESSFASTLRRWSIHPSLAWGGKESEEEVTLKPGPALHLRPKFPGLPGLLSKAGAVCSSHKYLMKIADSSDAARCKQVEDQINYDHLQKLEWMFHEADIDGGGGLDIDEFRKAMKKIMGNISDEDIDVIFMKVDTNCDGAVDWEEYLNYMLCEYRGKDDMEKSQLFPEFTTTMKPIPVAHAEEIVKIQFFPSQSRMRDRKLRFRQGSSIGGSGGRSTAGRFLTVSRDGILHYWSDSFNLLRTVHLDQRKRRNSLKLWVIDMICLPNINLMAVASTEQDIEFFDIGGNKCDRLFSLVDLDGCATAMDYWTDGYKGVFCVGDVKGNILIFTSVNVTTNGLFNVRAYIGGLARVPVQILMKGKADPYKNFTVSALHEDWCHQIMFIPQLNLVASCTPANNTAMALTSLPIHNVGKTQSAVIVLKKGILCFDYSSEMNILVTGGYDPLIRIWNPYVTSSPITQLKGHTTAVTHIMVNRQKNTMNIRVWDLLDHFCLQSIHGRNASLGNRPISAAYYHVTANFLACATYMVGVFFGTETETETKTQEQPVCCVLYNKNFKQVVSGYFSGMISVWDILTGQKTMEFPTSQGRLVEITAMTFDTAERRLITGLKNGTIKLWNFNSGACLAMLPSVDKNEISCIVYLNNKIFVSGWSRRVTWYLDTKEEEKVIECKHWKLYHSDDILSMDSYSNKLLVTASCNGDIVLWNVNSGQAFCRFNASQSPLILLPKREFLVSSDGSFMNVSPRKIQEEAEKKSSSHSRTKVLSRPASANYPQRSSFVSSSTHKVLQPQPAWYAQGSHKNLLQEEDAVDLGVSSSPRGNVTTWQEEVQTAQVAVEKVLFLNARERDPNTAILLTSAADGYIYAWALGSRGGMMGKFRGAHGISRDTIVSAMSTDGKDLVLFTGDSLGYIKIWDIQNYCRAAQTRETKMVTGDESPPRPENIFCSLIPEYCRIPPRLLPEGMTEMVCDGWVTSLIPPPCLSSWKGHLKNIVSVRYVERFRTILTSSQDGTIKLWLLSGRHIGTFGQALWKLGSPFLGPAEVPEEIRRVGSLHTLKVLNEGRRPHWESTRSIVQTLSLQRREHSMLMDFLHMKTSRTGSAAGKMQELIQKETRMAQFSDDQIETAFRKWEDSGKMKSDILGHAYKQKVPRPLLKQLPDMKDCVANKDQPRIYHCIQYTDLQDVSPPPVPDILKEAQLLQALAEQRAMRRTKRWTALSGFVTKPSVKSFMLRKQALYAKEVSQASGLV